MELDATARAVVDALDGRVLWVAGIGWMHWDGKVWSERSDARVLEDIREWALTGLQQTLDKQKAEPDADHRAELESGIGALSGSRLRNLLKLARGAHEKPAAALDTDPHLLNVANGVVDLRTGELRPHDPKLRMTKLAAVDYDPEARSDAWDVVLAAIPEDVRNELHVRIGQAATGEFAHKATLVHGAEPSGKTTFVRAVAGALGTYALTAPGLLGSRSAYQPTELADLRGARLVLDDEARVIRVDKMKTLLSGEAFVTRRIRQDHIEVEPSHTLVVVTNRAPLGEELDKGARLRLATLEFQRLAEQDGTLHQRLREPEAQRAVLRWVVDGARRWYAAGGVMSRALEEPATV